MKFICGNCGELIRESDSPMAFEGWQVHEACGHETFFDKFVVREREKDKQPVARRVRPIGDKSEGVSVEDHKKAEPAQQEAGNPQSVPSAADLDAVAREQEATAATTIPDGTVNEPRRKGKGAK